MRTGALMLFTALCLAALPALAQTPTASPQTARDVALEYRVESRLGELRNVDLRDVQLRVVRGALVLTGSVPNEMMHGRIIIAANSVTGIEVLRDELSIDPSMPRGGGPADDAVIVVGARAAVVRDPGVVGNRLAVSSQRGVVTISGHVATYADARRVLQRVRSVPGVRAVQSRLVVNESIVVPVHS